jgi:hypothetical protein
MPTNQFQNLSITLEESHFDDEQLRILRSLPEDTTLTMAQSIEILERFSFSSNQISALRIIAPFITDRSNQYQLYDAFTFSRDKDSAQSILHSTPPNNVHTPNRLTDKERLIIQQRKLKKRSAEIKRKEKHLVEWERQLLDRERIVQQQSYDVREQTRMLSAWEERLQNWEQRLQNRRTSRYEDEDSYRYYWFRS